MKMEMKKILLSIVLLVLILSYGCAKKDLTDSIDITQKSWVLNKIIVDGEKFKANDFDCFNNEAYILYFENDSVFELNTSINVAGGVFYIQNRGTIEISDYHEYTEAGGHHNEIDENLLNKMLTVNSYKVIGEDLYLEGDDIEIVFSEK